MRAAVSAAILGSDGTVDRETRRKAYDGTLPAGPIGDYAATVRDHAYRVHDGLVADARKAGLDDDGLFEIAVAAAVGQATRQIEHALAALDAALAKEV
jgi:hypothetical protein